MRLDFTSLPELVWPGTVHRCTRDSPRRLTLNEPVKARTPWADLWTEVHAPTLSMTGREELIATFSASPAFGRLVAAAGIG
jgi:hypothetical protein